MPANGKVRRMGAEGGKWGEKGEWEGKEGEKRKKGARQNSLPCKRGSFGKGKEHEMAKAGEDESIKYRHEKRERKVNGESI